MAILKKADILQGINDPQKIMIKSLGGELWLRPLSSAELNEIDNIEARAVGNYETNSKSRMRGRNLESGEALQKGKFNLEKVNKAQNEAQYYRIFKSLDNPKNADDPWTEDDIGALKREHVEEIDEKILELSGANVTESDVKKFPEDQ